MSTGKIIGAYDMNVPNPNMGCLPIAWDNARDHKQMPRIISVAVLDVDRAFMYFLPSPHRHHHVLRGMAALKVIPSTEGFMTELGGFVRRDTALVYAIYNKQLRKRLNAQPTDYAGHELFSEDLW